MEKSGNEKQSIVSFSTPLSGTICLDQVHYEVFEKYDHALRHKEESKDPDQSRKSASDKGID